MRFLSSLLKRLRPNRRNESPDGQVQALMGLAYQSLQKLDYIGARQLLLKALERRGKIQDRAVLLWILGALATTWEETEQHRDRAEFFSQYIAENPNEPIGYTLRGGAWWYSGELDSAVADYSKALEFAPADSLALNGRGQVFVERREFQRALEDLDLALENIGRLPIKDEAWQRTVRAYILNGRAAALAGLGKFDQALNEFEKSISLSPQNAWVFYNRAEAYENRGERVKALEDYRLALSLKEPKLNTLKRKYAELKLRTLA